ncbi:LuxR family transcriptional regulator [Mycolicibacterium anyangense]|uniref:LuxR family transcriptional regulator n=1 Tax=Mycolicibacterium anyangense TaxID=1431246 RepID=A0A6N4VYY0_9MYCO|nr:LuxR C-terminal-related transcriptional regulator [Mycolicibacterium anyangense]BBZ74820.1 LuxR family transcriptional regulator [Mycolicibacterium anyangense]
MIGRLDGVAEASSATALSHLPAVVGGANPGWAELPERALVDLNNAVGGVQQAVHKLISASSADDVCALAPEAATLMGFSRALFSRVDHGIWLTQHAHAVHDADFADQVVAFGTAHSRRLSGQLMESEMLFTGTPILVRDAQTNPRAYRRLALFTCATDYVAAPVLVWGQPIGMIHADRYPDPGIEEVDRRLLGLYACGLGLAMERAQLADRLRAINDASASFGHRVDEQGSAAPQVRLAAVSSLAGTEPAIDRLSLREWDVLRSIALGKTNAQIAAALFLTENTVKVHVKRILRKLGASNRTEAAGLYHRLTRRAP